MNDPRTHVVPAGSPVTVHYTDGRPSINTHLDFPFFFDGKKVLGPSLVGTGLVAICDVSKSVDAYVVMADDIHLRETEAV